MSYIRHLKKLFRIWEKAKKRQGERTDLKNNIPVNLPECKKEQSEPELPDTPKSDPPKKNRENESATKAGKAVGVGEKSVRQAKKRQAEAGAKNLEKYKENDNPLVAVNLPQLEKQQPEPDPLKEDNRDTRSSVKADKAIETFNQMNGDHVHFLSCEPLSESVNIAKSDNLQWVIVGGQSKIKGLPAHQPAWEWVNLLINTAQDKRIPLYFKPNLEVKEDMAVFKEMPSVN